MTVKKKGKKDIYDCDILTQTHKIGGGLKHLRRDKRL